MNAAELHVVEQNTFVLTGELTFSSVPNLWRKSKRLFTKIAPPAKEIVVDLDKVTRTDSAGLALMIELLCLVNNRNMILRFRNIPKQMLSLAKMTDVDFLFSGDIRRHQS
uniref:Phospholipid transport system transporter-binding protein n=1 Tax=Candidatus Kentrum eta TaxID=2126337 RepID=A0A450ULB0_9GAMM|nr:MAG: phospholipid transport system transporter-binding protein [Candidatus Kentron sp. H]VFJ94607.1 MAG: phospholipid transport system transporter-binding protein [Candidatus Kentron sp. H]VFK00837.1 MAG: phospholipid transport system transporter-binding protein [Candidatus Kentron sp. H]